MEAQPKPMATLGRDATAERFAERADLSGFKPMRFELESKFAALNMRRPQNLLDDLKSRARAKGVPCTRYVRLLLENEVALQAVRMAPVQPPE